MKGILKRMVCIFCVLPFAFSAPAGALAEKTADLSGYWVSLEFGFISFLQTGNSFSASWSGVSAAGTITGNSASFAFWMGKSYEAARDDEKGHGTLTVSEDGRSLTGQWQSADRQDKESGTFNAIRAGNLPAASMAPSPEASEAGPAPATPGPDAAPAPAAGPPAVPDKAGADDGGASALQGALAEAYQAMVDLVNALTAPFLEPEESAAPEPEQTVPAEGMQDTEEPPGLDEALSDLYQALVNLANAITEPILSP